jgi:transcriptional regulator with XRE-family HTH domain
MHKPLDPNRLQELRRLRKLSQKALADKAKLSKETVHRLEKGRQPGSRQRTLEGLAEALEVEAGVLTGEAPMPKSDRPEQDARDSGQYQINVRVGGAVRNAFSLTVLRYRLPIARIIELAPFLFVAAAEASLERRRAKLAELEALFDEGEDALNRNFPYLPFELVSNYGAALDAEKASIDERDILAAELPDEIFLSWPVAHKYDAAEHNPFVLHLKQASPADTSVASIGRFGRHDVEFSVCREDALKLAAGEAELADGIVNGWVLLNEMPRDLLGDDAAEARTTWLREKVDAARHAMDHLLDDL